MNKNELLHYGVIGMKWGVRKDKSMSYSQKKQLRKSIRDDNAKAFEIGKNATVKGRALVYGQNKTIKLEKKLDKYKEKHLYDNDKRTKKLMTKITSNYMALKDIGESYKQEQSKAKQHVDELIKKYGKENVKDIKYKQYSNERIGTYNVMDERVITGMEWVTSAAVTAASSALMLTGNSPVAVLTSPKTADERGKSMYKNLQKTYYKELRK